MAAGLTCKAAQHIIAAVRPKGKDQVMGFLSRLFGPAEPQPRVTPDIQQPSSNTTGTGSGTKANNLGTDSRRCFVVVSVRNSTQDDESWRRELGEFHEVWRRGISIGSDPACTVVLPSSEVAPVAVRVLAASNHKVLYRLPPGTALPLPPVSHPIDPYDERVDSREFQVGPYTIRFAEKYRDG